MQIPKYFAVKVTVKWSRYHNLRDVRGYRVATRAEAEAIEAAAVAAGYHVDVAEHVAQDLNTAEGAMQDLFGPAVPVTD